MDKEFKQSSQKSSRLFSDDDDPQRKGLDETETDDRSCWKMLIVDDKLEAHQVAKLALRKLNFENKSLKFYSAFSADEARELLGDNPDTALILLDVVMENDQAGLELAQYIRQVLKNRWVRIVIRTGYPGKAPEELVFLDYDINDYVTKTEMTREKMVTAVIGALRSFRDIEVIEKQKKELEVVNRQLKQEMERRKQLEAERIEQEKLRLEKEFLAKQTKELSKLNSDKDKFFSIVAHDLKGPFLPVLGNAELLIENAENIETDELRERCKVIYDAGTRVIDLLDNLLQWSRMQTERINFEPTCFDLKAIIDNNIWLFSQSAANKEIALENQIKKTVSVFADVNMLNIVIRNLTSNAIKFTSVGGRVTISRNDDLAHSEQDSDYVELLVRDTGVGIPPKDQYKLFKIDQYYTTTGTDEEKGTGLGLIIVKEMVERNGGKIWFESEPGKGTTFYFTVPRNEKEPA